MHCSYVGLNVTRHQDQEKAITEADEIRKHLEALVSKNESLHLVSYCDDCVVKTERVELETCNTCPFNKNK